jgi:hypothetical protein
MAGYSKTALAKKLGIKEGAKIYLVNAPANYQRLVSPLPPGVKWLPRMTAATDVVHVFSDHKARLEKILTQISARLKSDGAIWVSWPKKASGVRTDVTEDAIRDIALALGLVDIKVCAVDETWSGLKLVIRKENRKKVLSISYLRKGNRRS